MRRLLQPLSNISLLIGLISAGNFVYGQPFSPFRSPVCYCHLVVADLISRISNWQLSDCVRVHVLSFSFYRWSVFLLAIKRSVHCAIIFFFLPSLSLSPTRALTFSRFPLIPRQKSARNEALVPSLPAALGSNCRWHAFLESCLLERWRNARESLAHVELHVDVARGTSFFLYTIFERILPLRQLTLWLTLQ